MKSRKHRITIRINNDTKTKMQEAIENDGYGKRKKAKWISESIESLLDNANYIELVEIDDSFANENCNYPEGIYISEKLRLLLDKALYECRKTLPHKSVTQSAIIRTAIMQRLLRRLKLA